MPGTSSFPVGRSLEEVRVAREALELNLRVRAQDGILCLGGQCGKPVRIWYCAGLPLSPVSCFQSVLILHEFFCVYNAGGKEEK